MRSVERYFADLREWSYNLIDSLDVSVLVCRWGRMGRKQVISPNIQNNSVFLHFLCRRCRTRNDAY